MNLKTLSKIPDLQKMRKQVYHVLLRRRLIFVVVRICLTASAIIHKMK